MPLAHNIENIPRTGDVRISQDVTFDAMLLAHNTLKGLHNSGFYRPSPIQLHGIPLGKCGFDLLLEAKSGTGKTAVFSIIALEKIDLEKGLQTVILAPTREIAAQICDVIKQIGFGYNGLKVEVVMGGLSVQDDIAKFRKRDVHILVGSPGRLRHLIQEKHIDMSTVRLLVLDEADKLMEKSFQVDINYIFSVLPGEKQVIMSSATYPESTRSFINKYVLNAQHICPDSNSILLGIEQKITIVKYNSNIVKQTKYRFEELLNILSKRQFKQCLIFCNYQTRVIDLHKMLTRQKWPAELLYGQQEQLGRLDALRILQDYKCRILISTDLAARGIDASNVDLVINFEPPFEWQTYLHRIGRAGRFGSYGIAVTILSEGLEQQKFDRLLSSLHGSINLRNLWSDDKRQDELESTFLSESFDSVAVHSKINDKIDSNKYQKLWKLFTHENREEVQSETTKIESFCDLLNSFETYHQQDASIIKNNDTNDCWEKQINSVQEYYSFVKDILNHTDKQGKFKNAQYRDLLNHNQNGIYNKTNSNINNYPKQIAAIDTSSLENLEKKIDYQFEDIDATEALRSAGLPTCFGKIRQNHRNFPKNNKKKEKENLSSREHSITDNLKCDKGLKKINALLECNHKKYNMNIENHNKNTEDNFRNNLNIKDLKLSEDVQSIYCRHNNTKKRGNYTNHSDNYFNGDCVEETLDPSYIRWYNNLKFKVCQIEYAVYIEETLKLYR